MLDKVLKNVPMNRVVAIGVGAGVAMGTALFALTQQPTLPTMTTDWNAATKDYRRYQNMDGVFADK